jgi:CYTH domain-containing protein
VPSRQPGAGRYSQLEREQRWVLSSLPASISEPKEVLDRYVIGTSLRLRRVESPDEVLFKLTQKIRVDATSPERVRLTNMYLSHDEFALLAELPARVVRKTRWRGQVQARRLAVDQFLDKLEGLVLAEIELDDAEPWLALPEGAVMDVTTDDRFSGGALAGAGPDDIAALLDEVGRRISS